MPKSSKPAVTPLTKSLAATVANMPTKPVRTTPLWKGPEQDGVTLSLLSKFLVCRERFRLYVVEGLRDADRFNHRIEYGNMWHVCEEAYSEYLGHRDHENPLDKYADKLCRKYPLDQEQVKKWWNVCRVQFQEYARYWSKHPDTMNRTPLLQEQVFDVPYKLPSGRTVRLRGKWDSVDLVGTGTNAGIWLQENKTKGTIDERQLKRQLTFDLQTMLYLVSLERSRAAGDDWSYKVHPDVPIVGVRYNVVRRPLSGGKGTIVQKKGSKNVPAETEDEYYARLAQYIKDEPDTYFIRWNVPIAEPDITKFRRECLDPILEQLCNWWSLTTGQCMNLNHLSQGLHFRMPFGVYSPLLDGGETTLDEYLAGGSDTCLTRVDNLFPELS